MHWTILATAALACVGGGFLIGWHGARGPAWRAGYGCGYQAGAAWDVGEIGS